MEKARALLAPGGLVWLQTPNFRSLDASLFRHRNWAGYHCPRHWAIFSEDGLRRALSSSGLEPVRFSRTQGGAFWAASILGLRRARRPPAGAELPKPLVRYRAFGPLAAAGAGIRPDDQAGARRLPGRRPRARVGRVRLESNRCRAAASLRAWSRPRQGCCIRPNAIPRQLRSTPARRTGRPAACRSSLRSTATGPSRSWGSSSSIWSGWPGCRTASATLSGTRWSVGIGGWLVNVLFVVSGFVVCPADRLPGRRARQRVGICTAPGRAAAAGVLAVAADPLRSDGRSTACPNAQPARRGTQLQRAARDRHLVPARIPGRLRDQRRDLDLDARDLVLHRACHSSPRATFAGRSSGLAIAAAIAIGWRVAFAHVADLASLVGLEPTPERAELAASRLAESAARAGGSRSPPG